MLVRFSHTRNHPFLYYKPSSSLLLPPQTHKMVTQQAPVSKRPICPCCSKPLRLCLCSRIKNPNGLNNPVTVTILQHSLEKNHPLNSARIARLGLNNLTVFTVCDVHFHARFVIRLLEPNVASPKLGSHLCDGTSVIAARIGKKGVIESISHRWMGESGCKGLDFDAIKELVDAREALAKGFVVQKLNRYPPKGNVEGEEVVEFEMEVPAGSVLLFPSKEAVSASELEAMGVKVKNLIVLDGTWLKAKRMYAENPWLKLLPHLRLNLDKASLYSEVRIQPKPGCLSTIESIVYALKAVGDSPEGLDNLLEVFESMVVDQRRCKEERLSNVSLAV